MGTVAQKEASSELQVVIVSGDKDLLQLVNDHVSVYDTMKAIRYGAKEVETKMGVPPAEVVEVLTLAGDASDNIPGISGIGPKTAVQLIQEYHSVENILANLEKIKTSVRGRIEEKKEELKLYKQLTKIDIDVSFPYILESLKLTPPHPERMQSLFSELGFTKLLQQLAPTKEIDRSGYRLIQQKVDFIQLLETIKKQRSCALDLETTSLDQMQAKIVGVSVAFANHDAFYIPVGHRLQLGEQQLELNFVLEALRALFLDPNIEVVGQNLKYDLTILKRHDVEVKGKIFDTMVASYLVSSGPHNLDTLAQVHLHHTNISYEDVTGKGKKQICFDEVPLLQACEYAAEDADVTFRLSEIFRNKLKELNLLSLFDEMEMRLLRVLMAMEMHGVALDVQLLAALSQEFDLKLRSFEQKIYEACGREFNIKSPKQLGEILFGKLQLPGGKRTKTGYSTSQEVLDELALHHELPRLILEYRSISKLKSTYVDALPKLMNEQTGRLHTSLNQAIAATGRLSSSDPNLQNIPIRSEEGRRIRKAFVAPKGFLLLDCDYSQIELRVLAHMSRDEALIDAFTKNLDVHAITASGIYGIAAEKLTKEQRNVGKTVNFSTIYGQSAFGLSKQLDIHPEEANAYIDRYFATYPKVSLYRDEILAKAKKEKCVSTLFGRRRLVPDIVHPNHMVRQAAERAAFNTVFQGTAADIIKRAMITIHEKLPNISPRSKMLLQVHDELIFEVPQDEIEKVKTFVVSEMQNAAQLDVPLLVEAGIGPNWDDAH